MILLDDIGLCIMVHIRHEFHMQTDCAQGNTFRYHVNNICLDGEPLEKSVEISLCV